MKRRLLALPFLALGCAGPAAALDEAPVSASATAIADAPPQRSTRERLDALILGADIQFAGRLRPQQAQAAREAGFNEDELLEYVAPLLHACLDTGTPCTVELPDYVALALLVELGGARGLELATSFALLGKLGVEDMLRAVLERRVLAAMDQAVCEPPRADELAAARDELVDFRVFEATSKGKLRARKLEPAELDDLAYFMAATRIGDRVDAAARHHAAEPDAQLVAALEQADREWQAAIGRASLEQVYAAGERYLALLGWPDRLQIAEETSFARGRVRPWHVRRDMALLAELLGRAEQARLLWTWANGGGGMTGTYVGYVSELEVRGSIRTAELLGDCRPSVAERLLDVDADDWWTFGEDAPARSSGDGFDYGVQRLAEAGFDLARLYRGALLTRNRHGDPSTLAATLVGPDAELARARLLARGNEDWEWRFRANEGLADTVGEAALEPLLVLLSVADAELRARVIQTIGRAAQRPWTGTCDPSMTSGGGRGSSHWYRVVRPFGYDCASSLDEAEVSKLARRLLPYLRDADPQVRVATAEAFVDMLALDTLPALREQAELEAERAAREEQDEWVEASIRDDIAALERDH